MKETITVTIDKNDAQAIALGALEYVVQIGAGSVERDGSPMRVRRAIASALAEKGWWPGA